MAAPNLPTDTPAASLASAAASALCALGARAVLVKGGHLRDRACDVLATGTEVHELEAARLAVAGSVMASDAFFPFRDGIDAAAKAGIRAVVQPGGSMRDKEVIGAADEHGMAMVFTGTRHFRH